jgi:hypothetical protein
MATPHDNHEGGVTIRRLGEADAAAVRELAGRDSVPAPGGELLGLEIEGRLLAIQPLADGGAVIADPFARTAEVRALLELRSAQLRARAHRQPTRSRIEPLPERPVNPLAGFARAS